MAQTRSQILDNISKCGGMSYAEWIRFLDSVALLTDVNGGASLSSSLRTVFVGGDQVVINWLTDIVDGDTITYQQKHGSFPMIVEENQNDDLTWTQNGNPAYFWNAGRTILTLNPQTVNANFIIL